MDPIPIDQGRHSRPEDFILPIRLAAPTAASDPEPVEWWQWMPAVGGSDLPHWVRVFKAARFQQE